MFNNFLKLIIICISLIISESALSQDTLKISIETANQSLNLNDVTATAHVSGGEKPYKYCWDNPTSGFTDSISYGMTEGISYGLKVYDANGDSASISFSQPAESLSEKINSIFTPIVGKLARVILADIFAELGLYDNIIRDENGNPVLNPNGTPKTMKLPFVVVWLICGAVFCTIYMGFPNIRCMKESIRIVLGRRDRKHTSETQGEISHFQALTAALSATVGLGNIAGVALAITVGGPGATFWMIVAGFLGMASKFVECTLGVKYRHVGENGKILGGGMYYIPKAFKKIGLPKLGKALAYVFAALIIGGGIGGGCLFESNQAFAQFANVFPSLAPYGAIFGLVMAGLAIFVIFGGIKTIAKFTSITVPAMSLLYIVTALIIIFINIKELPNAVTVIMEGAFNPGALKGGVLGIIIIGFQRAALSNEAGIGSSPIAHSAVLTDKPIKEGIVALLEPFIDTVVICTMTALVIIFTGTYKLAGDLDGVQLTSKAFESVFSWFPYLLLVSIFLFTFSTAISWSYYSATAFRFITKGFIKNELVSTRIFQIFFLMFLVIGAASSVGAVIVMTDLLYLSLAFPNILTLYLMSKEVRTDLKSYMKERKISE